MTNSLRLNPPVFIDAASAVSLEIPKKNIVNVVICSAGMRCGKDEPTPTVLRCAALHLQRPTQGCRGCRAPL